MKFAETKPLINLDPLPEICCIYYVVTETNEIIYIGQTINLRKRWRDGHKVLKCMLAEGLNLSTARLEWQEFPRHLLNRVESCAIRVHKPRINEKTPPTL